MKAPCGWTVKSCPLVPGSGTRWNGLVFAQSAQHLVDDGCTRDDPSKQYGTGGKMQGKQYMLSLTWNAPQEAFGDSQTRLTTAQWTA